MTEAQFDSIDQTLRQLVSGQEVVVGRLDRIDGRLAEVDRRLDKLEVGQESLSEKFDWLAEKQDGLEEAMARGFKEVREEFDRRLGPVETAIRRLFDAQSP